MVTKLGKFLKKKRLEQELSQQGFSIPDIEKKYQVSARTISRIETTNYIPSDGTLKKITRVLGLDDGELLNLRPGKTIRSDDTICRFFRCNRGREFFAYHSWGLRNDSFWFDYSQRIDSKEKFEAIEDFHSIVKQYLRNRSPVDGGSKTTTRRYTWREFDYGIGKRLAVLRGYDLGVFVKFYVLIKDPTHFKYALFDRKICMDVWCIPTNEDRNKALKEIDNPEGFYNKQFLEIPEINLHFYNPGRDQLFLINDFKLNSSKILLQESHQKIISKMVGIALVLESKDKKEYKNFCQDNWFGEEVNIDDIGDSNAHIQGEDISQHFIHEYAKPVWHERYQYVPELGEADYIPLEDLDLDKYDQKYLETGKNLAQTVWEAYEMKIGKIEEDPKNPFFKLEFLWKKNK